MRDLDVRCPVCNRCVSIIGHNKIARHNNYNTRAPGKRRSYLTCDGSGADASELVAKAKQRAKIREASKAQMQSVMGPMGGMPGMPGMF